MLFQRLTTPSSRAKKKKNVKLTFCQPIFLVDSNVSMRCRPAFGRTFNVLLGSTDVVAVAIVSGGIGGHALVLLFVIHHLVGTGRAAGAAACHGEDVGGGVFHAMLVIINGVVLYHEQVHRARLHSVKSGTGASSAKTQRRMTMARLQAP